MPKSFEERYPNIRKPKSSNPVEESAPESEKKEQKNKTKKEEKNKINDLSQLREIVDIAEEENTSPRPKKASTRQPKRSNKEHNSRRETMADTIDTKNIIIDTEKYNNPEFKAWMEENKYPYDYYINFNRVELAELYEKWQNSKQNTDKSKGNDGVEGTDDRIDAGEGIDNKKDEKDNSENLVVSSGNQSTDHEDENTDTDWIKQKRESWNKWCLQEHNPAYPEIVEDPENTTGLKFDVYKTPEDKQAGKKAATVHYTSPRKVSLETEDGSAPAFEFFDKLVKEAKETDHVPGVTFDGEMSPEFRARLAAAALKNGLTMKNGPAHIDMALLGENVDEDLKKKIETFNKEQEYKNFYEQAKLHIKEKYGDVREGKTQQDVQFKAETEGCPKEKVALIYAAIEAMGHKVTVSEDMNKDTHGMFLTPDKKYFPEEARASIDNFNDNVKEQNITNLRKQIKTERDEKLKSASDEEQSKIKQNDNERLNTETYRKNLNLFRKFAVRKFGTELGLDPNDPKAHLHVNLEKLKDEQLVAITNDESFSYLKLIGEGRNLTQITKEEVQKVSIPDDTAEKAKIIRAGIIVMQETLKGRISNNPEAKQEVIKDKDGNEKFKWNTALLARLHSRRPE